MTRYKVTVEYDGTAYNGWQKQKDAPSVQTAIEKAIKSFCRQDVTIFCSGRTDSGVHSVGQIAHFDLNGDFDPFKVMMGINNFLREQCLNKIKEIKHILFKEHSLASTQSNDKKHYLYNQTSFIPIQDVVILKCEVVSEEFHARFSAKKRFYKYRILNRKRPTALKNNRVWHVYEELNLEKMQKASEFLIGVHDFSSFRDSDCQALSPIKTIDEARLYRHNENEIILEINGRSFLHHMVRNVIGTLKDVGNGKVSVEKFKEILEAKDRTKAGITAPACGLCFMKVEY